MGRQRKRDNFNIGRQRKYGYKNHIDDKDQYVEDIPVEEPIEDMVEENEVDMTEGEAMYNKIRAIREMEAEKMKTLNQNTVNNVNTYINDINRTIDEAKEFEDDQYEYVGAVYSLSDLSKLSVIEVLHRQKVPYVWVVDRNIFMYYVNGIWSDDKTVKDWVVVYKDDDLALKSFNGEVRMLLFKDIEDIYMDNNKIANILAAVSNLDAEVVENVIECVENGWSAEAIYNLNDGEVSDVISLEDVERIAADYQYWTNLGFNRVQVDYDFEVEDDNEDINLVELVTEEQEELNVEEVAPLLQTMDIAEIYNEIVEERNQQEVVDDEAPFNEVVENFEDDEVEFVEDEVPFNEVDFNELDNDEVEFVDDEVDFNEDELEFDDEMYEPNDEVVQENVAPQVKVSLITDVYSSGYLVTTVREGSAIPAIYEKVMDLSVFEDNSNNVNVPRLVLDDTLGTDEVVFEDQDLLAILKVRIAALLDLQNDAGEYVFKDDKCLNNVLDKLTEAQMWLDLWTKLN